MAPQFSWPLDVDTAREAINWFASRESSRNLSLDTDAVLGRLGADSYLWDLFSAIVATLSPASATVLGEKTPDHLFWCEHLLNAVPDLKVIGVVRDPREVLRSHRSVPWGIHDPILLADKWVQLSRRLDDCRRLFPDRVLALRYEEAVEAPDDTQAAIAQLLGIELARRRLETVEASLFSEHEWWKQRTTEQVERVPDTWQDSLSDDEISALEWRAEHEMRVWGYDKATAAVLTRSVPTSAHDIRRTMRSTGTVVLPTTATQVEAWQSSDRASRERWRHRAESLQADDTRLRSQLGQERAARKALEQWKEEAAHLRVTAETLRSTSEAVVESNRRLEADLARGVRETEGWKAHAREEERKALRAERAKLIAQRQAKTTAGKLRRLRGRRWWRLAGVLAAWRRQPWNVFGLARGAWRVTFGPSQLPKAPSTRAIDSELKKIERQLRAPSPATGLRAAHRAFDAGDYEAALALVAETPQAIRHSKAALLLVSGCYVRMGEVTSALAAQRSALRLGGDAALELQIRLQEGRLVETDPAWLPALPRTAAATPAPRDGSILHVLKESLPFFERGYTMRSHSTLVAQRLAGFEPTVVTSLGFPRDQGFASFPTQEVIDGIVHHRLDLGDGYPIRETPFDQVLSDQAALTARIAYQVRPSVIQAGSGYRGYETALVGLAVARHLGVPMIYEIRSFLEQTWTGEIERSEHGEYFERRYRQEVRCLTEADLVVTIAESMKEEIAGRGIDATKIEVVPNVVDVDRFRPRAKPVALAARYGLTDRRVLGYISNLGPREGIDNLIRAIPLLRAEGVDAAALIVGDGPEHESLTMLATELGVADFVVLTGHVQNQEIEDHYALIDLFVVPRIDDRAARLVTPLKPLEAMAMGIPVIAADLPALRELVAPGERGEVFEPSNPDALAAVAGRLLGDSSDLDELAANGMSWIRAERTLDANAKRYKDILDRVRREAQ